jgi:hypothetical protein
MPRLAVALLVDVWPDQDCRGPRVSSETAILVIDAALRSDEENARADGWRREVILALVVMSRWFGVRS